MRNTKYLLLIKASYDICENEINIIKAVSKMNEIETIMVDLTIGESIEEIGNGYCFDLVYLCGHGNFEGMGNIGGWDSISIGLCKAACTKPGATIFCACCRGGLISAADSFFKNCDSVEFVVGPKSNINPQAITLGFCTFMYNLFVRQSDPDDACKIASVATGQNFIVHDMQHQKALHALGNVA